MSCYYCRYYGGYSSTKHHINDKHSEEQFVVVDRKNRAKCAICHKIEKDDFNNLVEHFQSEHSYLLQSFIVNPIIWSDDMLNEHRRIKVHKKIRCNNCSDLFDTENQMHVHHADSHGGLQLDGPGQKVFTNNIEYMICFCGKSNINPSVYFEHVEPHFDQYNKCSVCLRRSKDFNELVLHLKNAHSYELSSKAMDACKEMAIRDFRRCKFVFGNGLVATPQNLIGTQSNVLQVFLGFVDEFLSKSMQRTIKTKSDNKENDQFMHFG